MRRLILWLRETFWPDVTIRYPVYGPHPTVAFMWAVIQRGITEAYSADIGEWDNFPEEP